MKAIPVLILLVSHAFAGDVISRRQAEAILGAIKSLPRGGSASANPPTDGAESFSNKVVWLTDYSDAVALAEAEGKPLLAYFTMATGCPYCVLMDRFHQENAAALQNYVCVKMPTDAQTRRQWKVRSFPSQFVVRDGIITRRWSGLFVNDSARFGAELERARQ